MTKHSIPTTFIPSSALSSCSPSKALDSPVRASACDSGKQKTTDVIPHLTSPDPTSLTCLVWTRISRKRRRREYIPRRPRVTMATALFLADPKAAAQRPHGTIMHATISSYKGICPGCVAGPKAVHPAGLPPKIAQDDKNAE